MFLILSFLTVACGPFGAPAAISDAGHTPAAAPATTSAGLIQVPVAIGAAASFAYLPYDVARALKYFEADGLEMNLRYIPGTTQAVAALLSGSVMFSADSLEDAIRVQPQGKAFKMIVSFTRCPGVAVLVRSDLSDSLRSPADFKGKKIGVTSFGASTHLLAAALAARAGLKLEDYTAVAVGSSTMAAAFAKQAIDVGLVSDPFATQLLKSGKVVILADLRAQADTEKYLGGEFPFVGMLASGDTLQGRPDIVQKMVNAIVKAQAYMRAHTARELADALPDDVTGRDKQAWTDAYSASVGMYSADGRATQTGVENVVSAYRLFGAIKPDDKIDAAALYDTSFVDKVK